MVQLLDVHPQTVRPMERPPRVQTPDDKSRGTRDNAIQLRHVERTCPYHKLRRADHSFLTRCVGWLKGNRTDDPIFYLDTLITTVSESIEAMMRRRPILSFRFGARMGDTRAPKKGKKSIVDSVSSGRP